MNIEATEFGEIQGNSVTQYTLSNENGMQVKILTYGGIIHELTIPDRQGKRHSCVQSCGSLAQYIEDESYRGAIVGRYANRIGHAQFSLNDTVYNLDKNGGEHNLHGGLSGFHKQIWQARTEQTADVVSLHLTHFSPDGEGGFPGNVTVHAVYRLDNTNTLQLQFYATTDKATPFSLTQHAYFTLSNGETVHTTQVQIDAEQITEVDNTLLPTGKLISVANTPFDFTSLTAIGDKSQTGHPLFNLVGGYDHNFVLAKPTDDKPQAQVYAQDTGINMALYTSLPGIQFYTGNIQGDAQLGSLCLEPQHFPDAPNQPNFPNCIIDENNPYRAEIRYQFNVD